MLSFGLSTLTSMTALLGGGITDEIKKLLQPQVLVSTAIFFALQLTLVLPVLGREGVGVVTQTAALSTTWQVTLGSIVFFVVAYLIGSSGVVFLNVASGKALAGSPIVGRLLLFLQRDRFAMLQKTFATSRVPTVVHRAAYALAFDFPRDAESIAPTGLGNVLLATWSYVETQYGAHVDTLWPAMSLALDEAKEDALRARLRASQDALNFLAGLSVLLAAVAFEVTAVHLALTGFRGWQTVLGADAALVIASAIAYFAAVQKARDWGRDVRLAFHLYLDAVAARLGLLAISRGDPEKRRERWREVSSWMAYGALHIDKANAALLYKQQAESPIWYEAEKPALKVSASAGIQVEHVSCPCEASGIGTHVASIDEGQTYLIIVTSPDAEGVRGAFVRVVDARVGELLKGAKDAPTGRLFGPRAPEDGAVIEARIAPDGSLVWPLGSLAARGTWRLEYRVRRPVVRVTLWPETARVVTLTPNEKTRSVEVVIDPGPEALPLHVGAEARRGVILEDFVTPRLEGKSDLPVVAPDPGGSPNERAWQVNDVPPGHRVHFDVPYQEQE